MRKRALLASPALAVGLALTSFAASVVKEEERKKKKLRKSSSAGLRREDDRGGDNVGSDDSGVEGSSNRTARTKRPLPGFDGNSISDSSRLPWVEPACDESVADDEAEVLQADWSLPTDTLVALKMMCQQFPKTDVTAVRPFVLRSQIYSSVSDRTIADRELEELKQQHVVRIFKLNSGKDDFGIMLMEDYLKQIEAEKMLMITKRSVEETEVFDWFANHVVTAHTGVSIRHPYLISLLSQGAGAVEDKHISLLINSGLLVRQMADDKAYWFGIPNVGSLLKSLSAGRKELKSFLAKRKYKEMIQSGLEKKRLRFSQFDIRFHIRDLIGSGDLYSVHTPVGPLIRIARD